MESGGGTAVGKLARKVAGLSELSESRSPSRFSDPRYLFRLSRTALQLAYQKAFLSPQWCLLFRFQDEISSACADFSELVPPQETFWADPHALQVDGRYYIFIEEYIRRDKKGQISVIEMDAEGRHGEPTCVLKRDYHLSYPCVFEWQSKRYMIPESSANRTIDLYECLEFPSKWELRRTLMKNIVAVDSTVFHHEGIWWLFAGIADDGCSLPWARLYLFYTDDLLSGDWVSHPCNPLVPDVRKGRPAGGLVSIGEKIVRPSQDCSKGYGYGLDLNEVTQLTATEYSECRVSSVRPDWDRQVRGVHTLAREGRLTVYDALITPPRWRARAG